MKLFYNKEFRIFLIKFVGIFCILYFGTLLVIALASPDGKLYSPFIDHHFDYVTWLRNSLLYSSRKFLSVIGYNTYIIMPRILSFRQGGAINIGYDCLGYGVISFWISFVIANKGEIKRKIFWIIIGVFFLWCINILRLSLILIFIKRKWTIPFFDQHTWFNIIAYVFIFALIYFYDRSFKSYNNKLKTESNSA